MKYTKISSAIIKKLVANKVNSLQIQIGRKWLIAIIKITVTREMDQIRSPKYKKKIFRKSIFSIAKRNCMVFNKRHQWKFQFWHSLSGYHCST